MPTVQPTRLRVPPSWRPGSGQLQLLLSQILNTTRRNFPLWRKAKLPLRFNDSSYCRSGPRLLRAPPSSTFAQIANGRWWASQNASQPISGIAALLLRLRSGTSPDARPLEPRAHHSSASRSSHSIQTIHINSRAIHIQCRIPAREKVPHARLSPAMPKSRPPPDTPRSQSCTTEATPKTLTATAKTSLMKMCETDAATACNASASAKKLNGAAKTSFTKKCVRRMGSD